MVITYTLGTNVVISPTNAGSYHVTAEVNDPHYTRKVSGTLVIGKAAATLNFDPASLVQLYDGQPKKVSFNTSPAGLEGGGVVTYNGASTVPTRPGSYTAVVKLVSANYTAPDITGTLTIQGIPPSVTTGVATSIKATSATLSGAVNPNYTTISRVYFEWGTTGTSLTNQLDYTVAVGGGSNTSVTATLSGLVSKTTYYYRLVVVYNGSSAPVTGEVKSFTTT